MDCQDAREHFSALLDAQIGLTEGVPLEAHLGQCEACQQELEALRISERPRPPAWRPNFKLDFISKALDGFRPADMMDRLRQRIFPRNMVIRRARLRPALFDGRLEMMRPVDGRAQGRRSVHARRRAMWRPPLTLDLLSKPLEAIRRIDIVNPIRRTMSSLTLEFGVVRRVIPAALPVDAVSRFRGRVLSLGRIRWRPRVRLGVARKALEMVRSLAVDIWAQRHVFLHVRVRHLRLAATVMLVTATAIALFRYRAELDVAVRHWVPSAPSSGEAPPLERPPLVASTEPATRPEILVVSPPATPVPAPSALYPTPAPQAQERPSPERPTGVRAPVEQMKGPAQSPKPVPSHRAPAAPAPVRDTRAGHPAKTSASRFAQREQALQKGKNGGAKQTAASAAARSPQTSSSGPLVASASPRKDRASETVSASTPPPAAAMRSSLDVVGRLRVKSRSGAERDLAALVARAGGTTVSRQRGDKITVIEAVVPNPSYSKFAEGLSRIGSWQIEAGRPRLPDPVRVTVRLAE